MSFRIKAKLTTCSMQALVDHGLLPSMAVLLKWLLNVQVDIAQRLGPNKCLSVLMDSGPVTFLVASKTKTTAWMAILRMKIKRLFMAGGSAQRQLVQVHRSTMAVNDAKMVTIGVTQRDMVMADMRMVVMLTVVTVILLVMVTDIITVLIITNLLGAACSNATMDIKL